MSYLLLGLQIALAAILASAAVSKLVYPQQMLTALRKNSISTWLALPLVYLVILCECENAFFLLFSSIRLLPLAFLGAFTLLGIFTAWILRVLRLNLQVTCGCFGPSHARVNKRYLIRNGCIMSIALGGFVLSLFTRSVVPAPSIWLSGITVVCMPVVLGLLALQRSYAGNRLSAVH